MQGLLSNPVISGLLSGGPNAVRARSQQQVAQMLPRGRGGMMGAPSPIVQSGGGMGAGLAGLGEGLQKFAQVRKEQAAQEQAKSSLEKVLGLQSGGEAIAQNVAAGGQPGPTQAAAQRQDPNPMKLPAGIVQAARMAYDAGDYAAGIGFVQKALTATNDQEYVNATNPKTGEIIPVRKGVQPPPGYVMSGDYKAPTADGTPAYKDAIILGLQPGTLAFNDYIRKRTLPSPPVTKVEIKSSPMQTEEQKARGTNLAARGQAIFDAGQAAMSQIPTLEMALTIADESNGQPLPSALQERAGTILQGLGFDTSSGTWAKVLGNVTSGQAFNGIMKNAILTKMQAQKGPQTESDMRLISQTVASLGNTSESRNFLLRSALSLARRDVEKSSFYEDYISEKGTYDGAEREWNAQMGRVPLFGVNPSSNIPVFFSEFKEGIRSANPDANVTDKEIREMWVKKYGRSR